MDRRHFMRGFALTTLAVPGIANTQPARKIYRLGILDLGATSDMIGPQPRGLQVNWLLLGLRELGDVYGRDFVTEPRGAEGRPERFDRLAAELVQLQVDVIVAPEPMLSAAKQATATIPIVMAASGDPVAQGLVQSLGHPGGNITGLSSQLAETTGKRLEMLKELVPSAAPVAVLWDRASLSSRLAAEAAAKSRGWKLISLEVKGAGEIDSAFKAAADDRAGALLVLGGGSLFSRAQQIAELAARNRLPAVYTLRPYVAAGGLISYGADINDLWRRAAVFVDKILKGAKPADMPVEQPTRFELAINLKAAKALGLAIPHSLLLRADEVIQ